MSQQPVRIVLVGHCVPDSFMLKNAIRRAVPGAAVEMVNDRGALNRAAQGAAVLLVNRVLDGDFGNDDGVELIRAFKDQAAAGGPRLMLVSDLAEHQRRAEEAGAVPGFGKRDANGERPKQRLLAALARDNGGKASS